MRALGGIADGGIASTPRARAGHRARDLPRREHHPHQPSEYDLTNTQYGVMFLPQVITAITASLLGAGLGAVSGPSASTSSASSAISSR